MTYEQRLKQLKATKIEHTLGKVEQNGFMDGDDYGSTPKPNGYKFTPLYNNGEDFICGAMGNAINFKAFLENHPLYIDRLEIIAGRWCDMIPAYRNINHAYDKYYPYEDLKPLQKIYDIGSGIGADAHCACDYNIGLNQGFGGMLDRIHSAMKSLPADNLVKQEFLSGEEIIVLSIQDFIKRHIIKAEEMLKVETDKDIIATLTDMIDTNKAIISDKPQSFLQACQWIAWFNNVSRMYDRDGAGCNLDAILYPYYVNDINLGIIDEEKAKFILANLLLNETHYYQLSGADEKDNDLTNPLSFLILEAAHLLNISVNLTVRVHEHIDPEFMKKAVYYLFEDRNAWPRFSGDKGLMNFMKNDGVTKADARKRIAVGCNWMAVPGMEYPINDCVKINVARVLQVALEEMKQSKNYSVNILFDILTNHLKKSVEITARGINHHLDHQHEMMPEMVMNLMMYDTIEKGEDISVCAKYHTMGVDGVGLGTVADSFAALEQRIERENLITWEQLFQALESNFSGVQNERIRLMLKSSERYCQGNSLGDVWAKKISELFANSVKSQPMPQGRQLVPGWFSWSSTIAFGKAVTATPDGRFDFAPVTHGANPNAGFRKDGASTAMATGIARAQAGYGNTCPLQLEMDPKLSADEGGLENVEKLLRTHIDMGGTLININILDKDKIMKAHENPMLYPDLVVRVTGFTAYFATLSPQFRQLVIDRFVEGF